MTLYLAYLFNNQLFLICDKSVILFAFFYGYIIKSSDLLSCQVVSRNKFFKKHILTAPNPVFKDIEGLSEVAIENQ